MNIFENIRKKVRMGVISLQYLPFHVQSCASKNCFINLDYIIKCHKSVELQRNLKHFKFWYFFTVNMIKPTQYEKHPDIDYEVQFDVKACSSSCSS